MKPAEPGNRQTEISQVTSLGQSGGENARLEPPSPPTTEYCVETLRDLSHAFAAVLMNAQVLDGKLPSYSRSKRYIHEIERSAQRGGAILKRLLDQFPFAPVIGCDLGFGLAEIAPAAERTTVVASEGPITTTNRALDCAPSAAMDTAPGFAARPVNAHRRM